MSYTSHTAIADTSPRARTERVENEIENLIKIRQLQAGDSLPSERTMAEMFHVSRTTVREALIRLAARHRVDIKKRGTCVAHSLSQQWVNNTVSQPLAALVHLQPGYAHDVMEIRIALEGMAAYHAAMRADPAAKLHIKTCLDAIVKAHGKTSPKEEAELDAAFHLSIAEASNNAILFQIISSLFGLFRSSISQSLEKLYPTPSIFDALSTQHRALYDAIAQGNAQGARQASDQHLNFVSATIKQIDDDLARHSRLHAARNAGLI